MINKFAACIHYSRNKFIKLESRKVRFFYVQKAYFFFLRRKPGSKLRIFGFSVTEIKRFFEFDITWPVPPSNPIESARRRGSFFLTHSFESRAERVRNRIYGIIFSSNDKDSLSLYLLYFFFSLRQEVERRERVFWTRE